MTKIKSVNVYDEINQFFDSSEMVTTIISRDMVEGYCRHSAWQGTKDAILRELWRDLRPLVDYLNSHRQLMAERLSAVKSLEYILVFEWMKGRIPGYNADFQQIARILGVWRDFFFYLSEKKQIDSLDEFAEAVELIAQIAQTGQQPKQGQPLFDRMLNKWISARSKQSAQALAENGGDFEGALAERVEQMLNEIVEFFSQPAYRNDMHRALWLFGGPLGEQHELDDMDFWGTFWDWFVFEYHLLDDDLTPLSHYQRSAPKKWSEFEEQIFRELTGLHYRVFYVESIKNGTWVVACDLLTDERFLLPYPDMEIRDIKRMLFYGRMSSRENALLNYLASIPVSTVLRKRIREELTKLKKLYSFQYPQVGWQGFLARHSHLVRHTIDILTNYATVNAAPVEQLDRVLADEIYCGCDDGVMSELGRLLPAVGLSRYDGQLLARMWMNFRSGESARVCNPSLWAAALIRTFAKVNAIKIGDFEALAGLAGVSAAAVGKAAHRIETALDIWPFDVRFLNEDGFMSYLYSYLHKLTEGLTKEEG